MIENIRRDNEIIMVHTGNRNVPIVRGFIYSWITTERTTIHDSYFTLHQDDDTFSFNYGDITDLMETLVHVKLTLEREFEKEKESER